MNRLWDSDEDNLSPHIHPIKASVKKPSAKGAKAKPVEKISVEQLLQELANTSFSISEQPYGSLFDLYNQEFLQQSVSKGLINPDTLALTGDGTPFITSARKRKPLILHSDRGSQYVSKEYKHVTATMQCSYSKKAYPWDNACIESFHSLVKREWLNRFKIRDYDHAYRLIFEYLEAFYNTKRIHSHCDYMSPNDYEELYRRLQQDELQLAG